MNATMERTTTCPAHGHEHQPRDRAVPCKRCSIPSRLVTTYNANATCDVCKIVTGDGCRG